MNGVSLILNHKVKMTQFKGLVEYTMVLRENSEFMVIKLGS